MITMGMAGPWPAYLRLSGGHELKQETNRPGLATSIAKLALSFRCESANAPRVDRDQTSS
jgi:hypothetical protein